MILSPKESPNKTDFSFMISDENFTKIALVAGGCLIYFLYWMQKQCRQIDADRVRVVDQFQ
jgi:hypothetical protein